MMNDHEFYARLEDSGNGEMIIRKVPASKTLEMRISNYKKAKLSIADRSRVLARAKEVWGLDENEQNELIHETEQKTLAVLKSHGTESRVAARNAPGADCILTNDTIDSIARKIRDKRKRPRNDGPNLFHCG